LGAAVDQHRQVQLLYDLAGGGHQHQVHRQGHARRLVGRHLRAEHLAGGGLHVVEGLAELHAAGLAATARVDLRLHHPGAVAQGLGGLDRFIGRGRDASGRNRDAIVGKKLFRLVLVEIHASPMGGERPPVAGGKGPETAPGRAGRGRYCRRWRGGRAKPPRQRTVPILTPSPTGESRLPHPSLIDRIESIPRRELHAFGLYRVLEAGLIAALAFSPLRDLAGPVDAPLAYAVAAGYIVAAGVLLVLGRDERWLAPLVLTGSCIDILAAALATHALPGVGAGIAMMLLFNVAAAAMLLRLRQGLAVAVLASLALVGEYAWSVLGSDGPPPRPLAELTMFVTSYLALGWL